MNGTVVFGGQRGIMLGHPAGRDGVVPRSLFVPGPRDPRRVDSHPVTARSLFVPGPRGTVRGQIEGAVDPVARRHRSEAAEVLGMAIADQAPLDRQVEQRHCPASVAAVRYAEAVVDLGYWQYRVEHAAAGPELAAALAERPDDLSPGVGHGRVISDNVPLPGGQKVQVLTHGQNAASAGPATAPVCGEQWPRAVLTSITARQRLISSLQAEQYRDIAELAATYPGSEEFLSTELALAIHTTDTEGSALLGTADALHHKLPGTLAALAVGRIDDAKASAMVAATANCDQTLARQVEQVVLPGAENVTATTVRRRAARAVITIDPDGAAKRHRSAKRERYVTRTSDHYEAGMGHLHLYAPAEDIATIWEAITATADTLRHPGDDRGAPARRADALAMIARDILHAGGWKHLQLPDRGRGRPHISVTVPYQVLLGDRAPCELDSHGPIPTEQALPLVGDGDIYRLLTDPASGQLLDYGRTRYRPPPHLTEFVRRRDGQCPMPTCHQPANDGEIDHIIPARPDPVTGKPTRGPTSAANLAAPCKHHHRAKDAHRGFTLSRDDNGTYTWHTPLGREYRWTPESNPLPEPCHLPEPRLQPEPHNEPRQQDNEPEQHEQPGRKLAGHKLAGHEPPECELTAQNQPSGQHQQHRSREHQHQHQHHAEEHRATANDDQPPF